MTPWKWNCRGLITLSQIIKLIKKWGPRQKVPMSFWLVTYGVSQVRIDEVLRKLYYAVGNVINNFDKVIKSHFWQCVIRQSDPLSKCRWNLHFRIEAGFFLQKFTAPNKVNATSGGELLESRLLDTRLVDTFRTIRSVLTFFDNYKLKKSIFYPKRWSIILSAILVHDLT